jgi:hypothetical protein
MSGIDVAVGVVNGKVIARWQQAVEEIAFDPNNAYTVGTALRNAARDAAGDSLIIAEPDQKMEITMEGRARILIIAGRILRSMQEQGKTPEQITLHVVDYILGETTR